MMTLLFLLVFIAIYLSMRDRRKEALMVFAAAFVLSLFWFNHHVGQHLTIVL